MEDSGSGQNGAVHDGKKPKGACLAEQLAQLQDAVTDMRSTFGTAMSTLSEIQYGDLLLQERVDQNQAHYQHQIAAVMDMVMSLKGEFSSMTSQLVKANQNQRELQEQVQYLQFERDVLLHQLENSGAIAANHNIRYHSGSMAGNLSQLSEETNQVEDIAHISHTQSDHDSGVTSCQMGDTSPPHSSPQSSSSHVQHSPRDNELDGFDSDSSLTMAANKSLDLSRSLGEKCLEAEEDDELENAEDVDRDADADSIEEAEGVVGLEDLPAAASSPAKTLSLKGTPTKVAPHEVHNREAQRHRVALEILETERKYCSNLWLLLDHFAAPLRTSSFVTLKELSVMFPPSLGLIYQHHCHFLQRLEERFANWKYHGLMGDIFARFIDDSSSELLELYQQYVNEFPAALHQIKKLCRNARPFRKYLKRREQDRVCANLDISAFMLTPVQRVPRYVLLLKQLLKYTPCQHPDHYHIETSLQQLGTFLNQLNDSIQHTMQVVTTETPKIKRIARSFSLRSNTSSCDESMANDSLMSRNESIISKNESLLSKNSPPQKQHTTPVKTAKTPVLDASKLPRRNRLKLSPSAPGPRPLVVHHPDQSRKAIPLKAGTVNGFDSFTLPVRGEKLRKARAKAARKNSSASRTVQAANDTGVACNRQVNGHSTTADHAYCKRPDLLPPRQQLFKGAGDAGVAGVCAGQYASQESLVSNGEVIPVSTGDSSIDSRDLMPPHYRSMPGFPEKFGVYGDNDSLDDVPCNVTTLSTQQAFPGQAALNKDTRDRAQSQPDVLQYQIQTPAKQNITLTPTHNISVQGTPHKPHTQTTSSEIACQTDTKPVIRMKSSTPTSPEHDQISQRNMAGSTPFNASIVSVSRAERKWGWRKKDKFEPNKHNLSLCQLDGTEKKKSAGIKQSLKNLFQRRKNSKSRIAKTQSFTEYSEHIPPSGANTRKVKAASMSFTTINQNSLMQGPVNEERTNERASSLPPDPVTPSTAECCQEDISMAQTLPLRAERSHKVNPTMDQSVISTKAILPSEGDSPWDPHNQAILVLDSSTTPESGGRYSDEEASQV